MRGQQQTHHPKASKLPTAGSLGRKSNLKREADYQKRINEISNWTLQDVSIAKANAYQGDVNAAWEYSVWCRNTRNRDQVPEDNGNSYFVQSVLGRHPYALYEMYLLYNSNSQTVADQPEAEQRKYKFAFAKAAAEAGLDVGYVALCHWYASENAEVVPMEEKKDRWILALESAKKYYALISGKNFEQALEEAFKPGPFRFELALSLKPIGAPLKRMTDTFLGYWVGGGRGIAIEQQTTEQKKITECTRVCIKLSRLLFMEEVLTAPAVAPAFTHASSRLPMRSVVGVGASASATRANAASIPASASAQMPVSVPTSASMAMAAPLVVQIQSNNSPAFPKSAGDDSGDEEVKGGVEAAMLSEAQYLAMEDEIKKRLTISDVELKAGNGDAHSQWMMSVWYSARQGYGILSAKYLKMCVDNKDPHPMGLLAIANAYEVGDASLIGEMPSEGITWLVLAKQYLEMLREMEFERIDPKAAEEQYSNVCEALEQLENATSPLAAAAPALLPNYEVKEAADNSAAAASGNGVAASVISASAAPVQVPTGLPASVSASTLAVASPSVAVKGEASAAAQSLGVEVKGGAKETFLKEEDAYIKMEDGIKKRLTITDVELKANNGDAHSQWVMSVWYSAQGLGALSTKYLKMCAGNHHPMGLVAIIYACEVNDTTLIGEMPHKARLELTKESHLYLKDTGFKRKNEEDAQAQFVAARKALKKLSGTPPLAAAHSEAAAPHFLLSPEAKEANGSAAAAAGNGAAAAANKKKRAGKKNNAQGRGR